MLLPAEHGGHGEWGVAGADDRVGLGAGEHDSGEGIDGSAQIGADTAAAAGAAGAVGAGRVSGVSSVRARRQAVTPRRVSTAKPSGNASARACRAA
jgi:hypothetical protein